ncbi:uncharacterized protein LOC132624538 [Lycium barbarum]|uniref:uncharacterized protein LOC132624538 n=1 Tax=Lycium barbarum TaxID=112863 RepID=UPI00293F0DD6|nr:uncharacterized protein LOC132624538 [Lycium barbarum]
MSLELKDGLGVTFISDMQKGLVDAVKNTLPNSYHRYCVRHIEANWQKKWRSGQMKKLMWWCAWSTYKEEFTDQLKKLGELSKEDNSFATKDLLHYPPQSWYRAYLDTKCKNMMVDNNFTESFNSWILQARKMPIIRMLKEIRTKVMRLLVKNEDEIRKWDGDFSPKSLKLYDDYREIAHYCKVEYNGDYDYEISEGEDRHIVDLSQKRCTCRVWQLSGIPCPHAIKAIMYDKGEPMDEMHWFYNKEAYSLTYKNKLQPIRGQQFWKITEAQAMDPPDVAKTVGRPKERRNREPDEASKRKGEWSLSRRGMVMTCSKCGEENHNARGCFKARLKARKLQVRPPTGTRRMQVTQGADGVSMPTDFPYSPTKTTWGDNAALTPRQLETQARRKRKKIESKGNEAVVADSGVECECEYEFQLTVTVDI